MSFLVTTQFSPSKLESKLENRREKRRIRLETRKCRWEERQLKQAKE